MSNQYAIKECAKCSTTTAENYIEHFSIAHFWLCLPCEQLANEDKKTPL
jgi:hypothetical protein